MDNTINTSDLLVKKSESKFKALAIVLFVLWAIGIAGGLILNNELLKRDYSQFQLAAQNNELALMYDICSNNALFDNETAVDLYEDKILGNSNHNILQGGLRLVKGDVSWVATANGISKEQNDSFQNIFIGKASYLNYYCGSLIFRDDSSKTIIHLKEGAPIKLLTDIKVGELIVDYNSIYYINLTDNSYVYRYDIIAKTNEAIIKSPTYSFVLIGDNLIVHSLENNTLVTHNKNNGLPKAILFNVSSYSFSDNKLYISDSYNIFSCTTNFHKEKSVVKEHGKIVSATNGNLFMINKFDQFEYITEEGSYILVEDVIHCFYAYINNNVVIAKIAKETINNEYSEEEIIIDLNTLQIQRY